jgi:hypothetical protein
MFRIAAFCLALATILCTFEVAAQEPVDRDARWTADLDFLVEQLLEIHPDPFWSIDRSTFESEVASVRDRIAELDDSHIAVELMRICALLDDGHTSIRRSSAGPDFQDQYPVVLYPFEDGVFLSSANADYADYVGGRVLRVGSMDVDDALARAATVASGENEYTIKDRAYRVLTQPTVVHVLGISPEADRMDITVLKDGAERMFTVTPVADDDFTFVGPEVISPGGVSARSAPPPLHLQELDEAFWMHYLEDEDLLYVGFHRVTNGEDESLASFVERVFAFADEHEVSTFVLDIRYNHGGNNQLLKPLIHGLIRRNETINRPGHFYTVLGRGTFSAAVSCTAWLEEHTDVRFVGEPAGSKPNHWGDARHVVLPNSAIQVSISAWRWQTRLPWDDRPWFAPQIPAPPTFADYVAGRDPALAAILVDRGAPSLEQMVRSALAGEGVSAVGDALDRYLERRPDRWTTSEAEINRLGYTLMGEGQIEAAIAVFQHNADRYPASANCYDSLAEAHLAAGHHEQAIALYRKALEVDPDFANAQAMLDRIQSGHGGEGEREGHHR